MLQNLGDLHTDRLSWGEIVTLYRCEYGAVGEALNRLRKADPEVAQLIPDISRIVGLRNILAHGYAVVDDAVAGLVGWRRVRLLNTGGPIRG